MTMNRVRVKICGITTPQDAQEAVACGTDAIGLVFAPSPRQVTVDQAKEIRAAVGPFVSVVGVFVNESVERILSIVDAAGLTTVQLHGDESADIARDLQQRTTVIKAFRIQDETSFNVVHDFSDADGFLFDTYVPNGERGGTGHAFNWSLLDDDRQSQLPNRPWILAGGLSADNVERALLSCRPYAVDVSSGVELKPGVKDKTKMREFIERVRRCHIE